MTLTWQSSGTENPDIEPYADGTFYRSGNIWGHGYTVIGGKARTPDGRVRAFTAVAESGRYYGVDAEVIVRGVVIPGKVQTDAASHPDAVLVFTPNSENDWPRADLEQINAPEIPSPLYGELALALGTANAVSVEGHATCAVRIGETGIGIRYHSTIVVLLEADGTIILDNGGYYSKTSLDRINRYTPSSISVRGMVEPHYSRSVNPNRYWVVNRDGEPIYDDFAQDFRGVVITTDRGLRP